LGVGCYSAPLTGAGCVIFPVAIIISSFENDGELIVVSEQSSLKYVAATNDATLSPPALLGRVVTFSPDVTVRLHLHINEISDEEFHAVWCNKNELKLFRACARYEAILLSRMGLLPHNSDKYCMRGLEFRTQEASFQRKKTKIAAREAVLVASYYYDDDTEYLAQVYSTYSRPCQKAAHDLALQDEIDAHI
jgi:hypothetical protein